MSYKTILAAALLILGLIGAIGPRTEQVYAQTPKPAADLVALYHEHILAINRGDLAAVMAGYAADAVLIDPRCRASAPCAGKEAIERRFQGLIADHLLAGIVELKASGDTVTGSINFILDGIKAAGYGTLRAKITVTYSGDKIARDVVELDVSEPATAKYVNFVRLAGIYRSHIDASNRGDISAALSGYTDDAELLGGPICRPNPCVGKAAIEKHFANGVTNHRRIDILDIQVSGDTLLSRVEVRNDPLRAAGFERISNKGTLTFRGDKIARHVIQNDLSDPQTAAFANFQRLRGIVHAHFEAVNRGDVDAVMATFADDAVVVRGARCPDIQPCVGKAAILRQVLLERENQIRFTIVSLSVAGDTLTASAEVRGVGPTSGGAERVIQVHTVTFSGDKIARFTSEFDLSDPLTAAFTNFSRVNRPSTLRAEAHRRGDIAGVMATLTDDAVLEGWGLCTPRPCVGKAAIQREVERRVADKEDFRLVTGTARVSGNTRTAQIEIRSDSITAAGVERLVASATDEVPVDKTSFARFVLDPTDPQTATFLAAQPAALPKTGEQPMTMVMVLAAVAGCASLAIGLGLRRRVEI